MRRNCKHYSSRPDELREEEYLPKRVPKTARRYYGRHGEPNEVVQEYVDEALRRNREDAMR